MFLQHFKYTGHDQNRAFNVHKEGGISGGGLGRLATWHLPGGPVGPPARWAATSNVEGGSGTEKENQGP